MNFAAFIPIVAILCTAWVVVSVIHYKQGRRAGCPTGPERAPGAEESRENARLAHENELLRRTIERLEQRTAVLERIATDPAARTAREIEELR